MGSMTTSTVTIKKFLIRSAAPVVRRQMLALAEQAQDLTSQCQTALSMEGALPDFIIIGTQKGGTTYLYDELVKQPGFASARTKEIHFFDTYFHRGLGWYRAFFPRRAADGAGPITGEASPSYLFRPHASRRAWEATPNAKLIVVLRNPVDRAYSHYHHEVRLGFEQASFEDALAQEEARTAGERDRMILYQDYTSHPYMHYSYLARGRYLDQLRDWHRYFPKEQLLVLSSDELQRDTLATVSRVGEFLGLRDWQPVNKIQPKVFPYPRLDERVRQRLADYFAPHNRELFAYLGTDYGWN